MNNTNNNSSGGIGFLGLLGIVFITLKLTGYINWSWWLVTLPIWGGFAIFLAVIAIWLGLLLIKYFLKL
jgi:hypothetical protein